MRIRELTLRNYRVYAEHTSFKFADRFTVVAGVNGRGKTALLDGLALLCSRFLPLVSSARSGYRTITPSEVHLGTESAELGMKVNCAGIPIKGGIHLLGPATRCRIPGWLRSPGRILLAALTILGPCRSSTIGSLRKRRV